MKNSLYQVILYLFLTLFIANCSNGVNKNKQSVSDMATQQNASNSPIMKTTEDALITKRIDNVANTSDDNLQEISILKSKIKYLEAQLSKKGEGASIFGNPYALFNQQIIMDNGTIYYGSVIYQDEQFITVETLIGKLNLNRSRIKRVLSHHLKEDDLPAFPEIDFQDNILDIEDGNTLYKSPANIILLGNINTSLDERGNTVLAGQLKNIGGKRADFTKINMTLYRDWSQTLPPKTFTIFAQGSTHYFDEDSTKVSDSSIESKAIAEFSLTIPRSFGNVISWKYTIDFEEY